MNQAFLIKYGEIAIKGKNRGQFENALVDCIRYALKDIGEFDVKKEQGRLFVEAKDEVDTEVVLETLGRVFGIVGICPVTVLDTNDFEAIKDAALTYMKENYGDKNVTFKVEVRRADKRYPMNSMEIAREVGADLLKNMNNLKVDVHQPEVRLRIELRNKTYLFSKIIPGLGGMPVGSNGKAMLMLSGGIDSPVAGWMIAKRGVSLEAVYYHSHPYTTDRAKQKVIDLGKIVAKYTGGMTLHIVPFTDIQLDIYDKCPHDQLTIIMRRIMMDIAERIAKKRGAIGLITGESIGQVASQTIQSLTCTNAAVKDLPVFRPLIGFDKQDIVDISEKIGTYETSILPYEDCCTIFVAKHPVTKPKLHVIERSERKLENMEEMIIKAIEDTEVIRL
ncbi:tRNA uracil 4-sulfurtransferase ThiI [Vallitalea okinawensis]|uniref:tRNA uracil 4-sulfurtransferase ThiI n=1 Tax=Vallitalea okinawensis TaxID=2078660 RepID=UPI000CFB6468|nr:tRNA uracil 4-sulfurtransferase ThiI [Vallitalea okinawensis]